ncbi:MAG: hypothetical protein ACTSSP_02120 [Candidatus Asgardarchaeia archaeon]
MYYIDFQNQLNDYLLDESRKIPKAHLDAVCKIYHQHETCRYLSLSSIGYVCMKKSPAKEKLDQMAIAEKMSARADNCEGLGEYE